MARYFALNTLAGMYGRTSSANVLEVTTAGYFNAAYVASGISVNTGGHNFEVRGPFLDGSNSFTTEFYLRADYYSQSRFADNGITMLSSAGVNAYRIFASSVNVLQFQYWNTVSGAWVNWGASWAESSAATVVTYIIKLNPNNSFTVYRNGATAVATSAVVPTNGVANVGIFQFRSFTDLGSTIWSQIMCADYDIRDSHMFSKLPVANGNYTAGTGAAADVNEVVLDDGTAINLPAVADKRTLTKGAIVVPTGLTIASALVNARIRVGGGVVTNAKAKVRSNSVDGTSGNLGPAGAYSGSRAEFPTNPDGAVAWAETPYNNAEFGLEAA